MHPRNKYQGRYDYPLLTGLVPKLKEYVITNPSGEYTIDYSNAMAVKLLNKALLKLDYQLEYWDIPEGYLSPAIPGRAEYIHRIADLLADSNGGKIPTGPGVSLLDIGTGANYIYPLIARRSYNWSVTGVDSNKEAVESATIIIDKNKSLLSNTSILFQSNPDRIFEGVIDSNSFYEVTVCNPPFHNSEQEAFRSSHRKRINLDYDKNGNNLNFGGVSHELWCPGGELQFVKTMIDESEKYPFSVLWYTSLISKQSNCNVLEKYVQCRDVVQYKVITWRQGQKKSRFLAWSHFTNKQIKAWRMRMSMK